MAAEYALVCSNLSHDYREAVSYNIRKNRTDSNRHVQKATSLVHGVFLVFGWFLFVMFVQCLAFFFHFLALERV